MPLVLALFVTAIPFAVAGLVGLGVMAVANRVGLKPPLRLGFGGAAVFAGGAWIGLITGFALSGAVMQTEIGSAWPHEEVGWGLALTGSLYGGFYAALRWARRRIC